MADGRGTVVLRGARVIDGTGAPAIDADVEIADGVIRSVRPAGLGGAEPDPDAEVVDLDGLVLAPGFIDLHTHYDAQVMWDTGLSPSPEHGVTSVVMGNCGFTVAPTHPEHREMGLGILECVEDMAPEALRAGVRWEFESHPQYLSFIDTLPKRINVASFIGHTALRLHVLGEDALTRAATDGEIAEMGRLAAEARAAGALGLSSSLAPNHMGPGGVPVPSFVGGIEELTRIGQAMGSGVVQVARGRVPIEDLLPLATTPGITVSWSSLLTGKPGETIGAQDMLEQTAALPGPVWPQISCRPLTIRVAFDNPVSLGILSCFNQVLALPATERAGRYGDASWMQAAIGEAGESWGPMWERAVALAGGAEDPAHGISVAAVAAERGLHPMAAMIALALEHGLATRFEIPVANLEEKVLAGLLQDRRTLLGLSDAGAHANQQCDASFATYLLGHWVRDQGVLTLEEAVWRLTGQPASVYGFARRGAIRPGAVADLVAFDPERVAAGALEVVHDLPGGAQRLVSPSTGIEHVWVAGTPIRRGGRELDATPGALLR